MRAQESNHVVQPVRTLCRERLRELDKHASVLAHQASSRRNGWRDGFDVLAAHDILFPSPQLWSVGFAHVSRHGVKGQGKAAVKPSVLEPGMPSGPNP